jgi:hypothetical protein
MALAPPSASQANEAQSTEVKEPPFRPGVFLSPRTVQHHLGKVCTKLGITSRAQLSRGVSGSQHSG